MEFSSSAFSEAWALGALGVAVLFIKSPYTGLLSLLSSFQIALFYFFPMLASTLMFFIV